MKHNPLLTASINKIAKLELQLTKHASTLALPSYRQPPLTKKHYVTLQKKFLAMLPASSTTLITSNHLLNSNADTTHTYHQNSELLYLTGIKEKGCTVLFHKNKHGKSTTLAFKETNTPKTIVWVGEKLSFAAFEQISGIGNIYPVNDFWNVFGGYALQSKTLWFALNQHARANFSKDAQTHLLQKAKERFPLHTYQLASPLLAKMRTQKGSEEIAAIKNAITVTNAGLQNVAKKIALAHKRNIPLLEFQLEAELDHCFTSFGSQHAFTPIIASGESACTLHYVDNNKRIDDNSSILIDCGATFSGYRADITRVLPAALKFTARQKEVYGAVYNVLHFAKSILAPGLKVKEYTKQTVTCMQENLKEIGLLGKQSDGEAKRMEDYFMHGISHQLGVDVHDVSAGSEIFMPGMVLTVEPGIYIAEENIGIRLEDDVVISAKKSNVKKARKPQKTEIPKFAGCECLSEEIVLQVDHVEAMMEHALLNE